jgi:hypothetical protein
MVMSGRLTLIVGENLSTLIRYDGWLQLQGKAAKKLVLNTDDNRQDLQGRTTQALVDSPESE